MNKFDFAYARELIRCCEVIAIPVRGRKPKSTGAVSKSGATLIAENPDAGVQSTMESVAVNCLPTRCTTSLGRLSFAKVKSSRRILRQPLQ